MNSEQKWIVGLAAGLAAGYAASQVARARRAIDFGGRVVLITGGSRGLGLILARKLAVEGARLVLLARDERELDRAKRMLEEAHRAEVMAIRCDVRDKADVAAAVEEVLAAWGAVDVLINNAGVITVAPMEEMTLADYDEAMQTHFYGPLYTTLAVLPALLRAAVLTEPAGPRELAGLRPDRHAPLQIRQSE